MIRKRNFLVFTFFTAFMLSVTDGKSSNKDEFEELTGSTARADSPQPLDQEWYATAKEVAPTWDQSLEEFLRDAHKFLREFQKQYPHERLPSITDLTLSPRPKSIPEGFDTLLLKFSVPLK